MIVHYSHMVALTSTDEICQADPDFVDVLNEEAPETTCHKDDWLTS